MSEGTTGNNPSAELTINVASVDPNIISDTHRDIAPIADYAIHDSSTSDDKASLFPSDDTEAAAEQIINIVDVNPHLQSESDSENDLEGIPNDIEQRYRAYICAWGLDIGEMDYYGRNPHFEHCCCAFSAPPLNILLPCAHNKCSERVHRSCPDAWFSRMRIQYDFHSPVYCPAHNNRYLNFVRQQEQRWNPPARYNDISSIDRLTLNGPSLNLEEDSEQQRQRLLIVAVNASLYDDGEQRYNSTARYNNRSSLDRLTLNGPSLNLEEDLEQQRLQIRDTNNSQLSYALNASLYDRGSSNKGATSVQLAKLSKDCMMDTTYMGKGQCVICQNNINDEDLITNMPCGSPVPHIFHNECLIEWLKVEHTCLLCKRRGEN
jgi:hypothetical protein